MTLYVDGVAVSTKSVTTTTVNFNGFNVTVSSNPSVSHEIAIKADFSDITTSGDFQIATISYDAVDTLTSASVTPTSVA